MPVPRLRMRPWLEKQIESKTIPGLSWLNKEEMIFQIPWKHAARHGWDINKDASLFRSWAIHTGRYKLGEKEPDPKTWKANFRCAMNSLPDIKEVKDKSIYKGSSAVRVYRMLPTPVKTKKKERKSKSPKDSKSKPRKKVDSLSSDEVEEAVKNCQLPEDHNSYTAPDYSIQEATGSTDIGLNHHEISMNVSSWNGEMEMALPDSTNDNYNFQVSPMPSSSEGEEEDIFSNPELLAILDSTNQDWQTADLVGRGYFTNEVDTTNSILTNPNALLEDFSMLGEIKVRVTTEATKMDLTWHELTAITCL